MIFLNSDAVVKPTCTKFTLQLGLVVHCGTTCLIWGRDDDRI